MCILNIKCCMFLVGFRKNKFSRVDGTILVFEYRASRLVFFSLATRRDIRVAFLGGIGRCGLLIGGDD